MGLRVAKEQHPGTAQVSRGMTGIVGWWQHRAGAQGRAIICPYGRHQFCRQGRVGSGSQVCPRHWLHTLTILWSCLMIPAPAQPAHPAPKCCSQPTCDPILSAQVIALLLHRSQASPCGDHRARITRIARWWQCGIRSQAEPLREFWWSVVGQVSTTAFPFPHPTPQQRLTKTP